MWRARDSAAPDAWVGPLWTRILRITSRRFRVTGSSAWLLRKPLLRRGRTFATITKLHDLHPANPPLLSPVASLRRVLSLVSDLPAFSIQKTHP